MNRNQAESFRNLLNRLNSIDKVRILPQNHSLYPEGIEVNLGSRQFLIDYSGEILEKEYIVWDGK